MKAGGFDVEPYNGNDTWMLPIPATFIVGRDGLVKARYLNPDYRRRMELDAILAELGSLAGGIRVQSDTQRPLSGRDALVP
jgi:peroxiredoxin